MSLRRVWFTLESEPVYARDIRQRSRRVDASSQWHHRAISAEQVRQALWCQEKRAAPASASIRMGAAALRFLDIRRMLSLSVPGRALEALITQLIRSASVHHPRQYVRSQILDFRGSCRPSPADCITRK